MQVKSATTLHQCTFPLRRILGEFGNQKGPLIIFIAGMHGNEPAGVIALQKVFKQLQQQQPKFHGRLVGLAGNLQALSAGQRFIDEDLNRVWLQERVDQIEAGNTVNDSAEEREQFELLQQIKEQIKQPHSTLAIIDLHTTSSQSRPFIPFDDTLTNRHFVQQIPVSAILGIEEFLPGTLLSYLNEMGGVALGYEAGQHTAQEAIDLHEALIWQALHVVGCLQTNNQRSLSLLSTASQSGAAFYEIVHRHEIKTGQNFKMNGQFESFAEIEKGQVVAFSNGKAVEAPQDGLIFMPLYQDAGNDGYFIVRPVNPTWLRLSRWLRQIKMDQWLVYLPGVHFDPQDRKTIVVNRQVAKFLALQLFHLLGYRRQPSSDQNVLRFRRREH